jgi:long-chain acyl-CoA synthetase
MKNIPLIDVRRISNLKEMLDGSAEYRKNHTAFLVKREGSDEYLPISYQQFKHDVDSLGTVLIHMGLKGKKIALIGENSYEWCVSYLATVNGTGITVPLDKELPQNEILNLLTRSKSNAVIFSQSIEDQMSGLKDKLGFIDFFINKNIKEDNKGILSFNKLIEEGSRLIESGDRSFIDAEINNEEMSILLFTSGTTDLSKGVMLSHKNITENLMAMCSMIYIHDDDVFLSILPIHHTYECTCGFLCPIYSGSTVAICEGLRHIPKNLKQSKATIMLGVPLIFEAMYKRIWEQASKVPGKAKKLAFGLKLSNFLRALHIDIRKKLFAEIHETLGGHVRLFISGAAGIDPIVSKAYRSMGILLIQGYGLTECSPIVALNRDTDYKDDAVGLALKNFEIKIENPDCDGIGQIFVKGPSVMLGYYEVDEKDNNSFVNGWFNTGDLGFIDKDKFLHITGRKKNVIITKNGKNVFPEEIETLLNRMPYISESLVYGVTDEDSSEGVIITASIVPNFEQIEKDFAGNQPSPEKISELIHENIKAVNKGLVIYKKIKDFNIRDTEFIKTTTKKIKRYLEDDMKK